MPWALHEPARLFNVPEAIAIEANGDLIAFASEDDPGTGSFSRLKPNADGTYAGAPWFGRQLGQQAHWGCGTYRLGTNGETWFCGGHGVTNGEGTNRYANRLDGRFEERSGSIKDHNEHAQMLPVKCDAETRTRHFFVRISDQKIAQRFALELLSTDDLTVVIDSLILDGTPGSGNYQAPNNPGIIGIHPAPFDPFESNWNLVASNTWICCSRTRCFAQAYLDPTSPDSPNTLHPDVDPDVRAVTANRLGRLTVDVLPDGSGFGPGTQLEQWEFTNTGQNGLDWLIDRTSTSLWAATQIYGLLETYGGIYSPKSNSVVAVSPVDGTIFNITNLTGATPVVTTPYRLAPRTGAELDDPSANRIGVMTNSTAGQTVRNIIAGPNQITYTKSQTGENRFNDRIAIEIANGERFCMIGFDTSVDNGDGTVTISGLTHWYGDRDTALPIGTRLFREAPTYRPFEGGPCLLPNGDILIVSEYGAHEFDKTGDAVWLLDGDMQSPPVEITDQFPFQLTTSWVTATAILPSGELMVIPQTGRYASGPVVSNPVLIYTTDDPSSIPAEWYPAITAVSATTVHQGARFDVTGLRMFGFHQQSGDGDEQHFGRNGPYVRLTSRTDGTVRYCHTDRWSTNDQWEKGPVTVSAIVPIDLEPGVHDVAVCVNGLASSDAFSITVQAAPTAPVFQGGIINPFT